MSNGRYERELCSTLSAQGYHVIRAPSSGGGTKRALPDVFWSKSGEQPIAGELKTIADPPVYVGDDEVAALQEFATAFGAQPRLILRVKGDTTFYLVRPSDGIQTDENVRVEREMATMTVAP